MTTKSGNKMVDTWNMTLRRVRKMKSNLTPKQVFSMARNYTVPELGLIISVRKNLPRRVLHKRGEE